jgi:hypothetical protein
MCLSMGLTNEGKNFTSSLYFKVQKKKFIQNAFMFYDLSRYKFGHAGAKHSLV